MSESTESAASSSHLAAASSSFSDTSAAASAASAALLPRDVVGVFCSEKAALVDPVQRNDCRGLPRTD